MNNKNIPDKNRVSPDKGNTTSETQDENLKSASGGCHQCKSHIISYKNKHPGGDPEHYRAIYANIQIRQHGVVVDPET